MLGWSDTRPLTDVLPAPEAKKLAKGINVHSVDDLLHYYPRAYSLNGASVPLITAADGEQVTVVAEVVHAERTVSKNGMIITTVTLHDGTQRITATFFRVRFIVAALPPGTRVMMTGKLRYFRGQPQLQHPQYVVLRRPHQPGEGTGTTPIEEKLARRLYVGIYPATRSVTSWTILDHVDELLAAMPHIPEPLDVPPGDLPSFDAALRGIHAPGEEGPEPHIERLKYNEALEMALVMALRKADLKGFHTTPAPRRPDGLAAQVRAALPYELTDGQKQVVEDIAADLESTTPMSRLLQGEVGSGKTVVSLLAMLQAIDAGLQCALLAPTEVLAAQHVASLSKLLAGVPVRVVLLTGSLSTEEKRRALLDIISGDADIVVGTHAIIQDSVEFFRLGLVVIDEQHRFGVDQRDRLRLKGEGHPHMLVMTATPIPRTIALTSFGDLVVSSLRELPGGRKEIASFVVPDDRPAWVQRTWQRLEEEVASGRQAYVVCPSIEGESGVKNVAEILASRLFPNRRIGVLHGKLRPEDKDAVMSSFSNRELDILVATTVIEVGVDVPNATVMVIRDADRFGISQLHQLRGRVGRGEYAGICFLMTSTHDPAALERLQVVATTTSGFELAEADVEFRREGDVLGTAQSGRSRLRLLSVHRDAHLIERATVDAAALVERNRALAETLVVDLAPEEQEFLDKK